MTTAPAERIPDPALVVTNIIVMSHAELRPKKLIAFPGYVPAVLALLMSRYRMPSLDHRMRSK